MNKNEIYYVIALLLAIGTFFYVANFYINTRMMRAIACGHGEKTTATILRPGFSGLNEKGEDVSCIVEYLRDGRKATGQQYNVGNCDAGRVINITYNSYICH